MSFFEHAREVAFCDTDAMAVVHHSNYLRYFEEARVAWMRHRDLSDTHFPHADTALAVIETKVLHHKPAYFGDRLRISLQAKRQGLKISFRYSITEDQRDEVIATGETIHVAVNKELRPVKLAAKFTEIMETEPWIETWPWSS